MPSPTSLKCLLDEVPSAIEVECPNERFTPRGAHESRSLQHRSHALRPVNKDQNGKTHGFLLTRGEHDRRDDEREDDE